MNESCMFQWNTDTNREIETVTVVCRWDFGNAEASTRRWQLIELFQTVIVRHKKNDDTKLKEFDAQSKYNKIAEYEILKSVFEWADRRYRSDTNVVHCANGLLKAIEAQKENVMSHKFCCSRCPTAVGTAVAVWCCSRYRRGIIAYANKVRNGTEATNIPNQLRVALLDSKRR